MDIPAREVVYQNVEKLAKLHQQNSIENLITRLFYPWNRTERWIPQPVFPGSQSTLQHISTWGNTHLHGASWTLGPFWVRKLKKFSRSDNLRLPVLGWNRLLVLVWTSQKVEVGLVRSNTGGRMNFTRVNFKPGSASSILQAFYFRYCLLYLINPSKLVVSKKLKSRIALLVHNAQGLFFDGLSRRKPARFALPETRPTLSEKSRGRFLN